MCYSPQLKEHLRRAFRYPSILSTELYRGMDVSTVNDEIHEFVQHNGDLSEFSNDLQIIMPLILKADYDSFIKLRRSTPPDGSVVHLGYIAGPDWLEGIMAAVGDYAYWAERHYLRRRKEHGPSNPRLLLSASCLCICLRRDWLGVDASVQSVLAHCRAHRLSRIGTILSEMAADTFCFAPTHSVPFDLLFVIAAGQLAGEGAELMDIVRLRSELMRDSDALRQAMPYFLKSASDPEQFRSDYDYIRA
jgi:hypothetical protein